MRHLVAIHDAGAVPIFSVSLIGVHTCYRKSDHFAAPQQGDVVGILASDHNPALQPGWDWCDG
jgi:hypothetical protein